MTNITPELRPWPTNPRYRAGEDGIVYGPYGRPVQGRSNGKGYLQIYVSGKNVRVHKIVCESWHGPAPTPDHEVAHDDGDKSNNRPDNLSWKTYAENRDDISRHYREGLYAGHEPTKPIPHKLTVDDVRAIRERYANGVRPGILAAELGVNTSSIKKILRGINYAWVK